jgi:Fe-S oxidoreductase
MSTLLHGDEVQRRLLLALEEQSEHTVYACYQCGKCTAACPFEFSPQRVMRHLQLGQVDRALTMETPWVCASCLTCSRVCPKDADPAGVMKTLRALHDGPLPTESTDAEDGKERQELTDLAAERYRRYSHPLRSYFFANIHDISRRGSRLAPASNWMARMPGSRLVAHHLLGVHKERALPEFVRPSFPEWFRHRVPIGDGHRGDVLLFHDTFMDYDAPQIGVAVTELLELAGYRVALTDTVCCGRPMISKGYMDQARARARTNVERLQPLAQEGVWIVGCEPSCLLTVREEYPRMLARTEWEEASRTVAERCLLIDEFLADPERGDELEFRGSTNGGGEVLFHGHCQQKAEADPTRSLELLRRAGFRAEMVRAPCCGMAGAFGFEREHYEASRSAFRRALGPALDARPDARIVVMGISCRKQIEHFAGRPALHLVEALRGATDPRPEEEA